MWNWKAVIYFCNNNEKKIVRLTFTSAMKSPMTPVDDTKATKRVYLKKFVAWEAVYGTDAGEQIFKKTN